MTAAVLIVLLGVTGYVAAKVDIYIMEKKAEQRSIKRWAELDAASDEKGKIPWSKFMEIQRKY